LLSRVVPVEVVVMVGGIIGIDNMKKYMLDFN
jgi:hypothetical protein